MKERVKGDLAPFDHITSLRDVESIKKVKYNYTIISI